MGMIENIVAVGMVGKIPAVIIMAMPMIIVGGPCRSVMIDIYGGAQNRSVRRGGVNKRNERPNCQDDRDGEA